MSTERLDFLAKGKDPLQPENRSIGVVLNSCNWKRTEWLSLNSDWYRCTIPSMGYAVMQNSDINKNESFDQIVASETSIENEMIKAEFNAEGTIQSIWDKMEKRELVQDGLTANKFLIYKDFGDAWDFAMDIHQQVAQSPKLVKSRAYRDGPKAVIEMTLTIGTSVIEQKISVTKGSKRVDFSTRIIWNEPLTMIRVLFPTSVQSSLAAYEIPFAYVLRPTHDNTENDLACREVPAQKWVDIFDSTYGIAILNDCKYGFSVKNSTIELNLLRNVSVFHNEQSDLPGTTREMFSDMGEHFINYALLPDCGENKGEVIREAYNFNNPLRFLNGEFPENSGAFIECSSKAVIIETVKKAENGKGLCIRLYESWGSKTTCVLKLSDKPLTVSEVNLIEDHIGAMQIEKNSIALTFSPFEIKTILVTF